MPFKSEAQRRYMYAKHPNIAKKWSAKYGSKIVTNKDRSKALRGK